MKFEETGIEITRLSEDDVGAFTELSYPSGSTGPIRMRAFKIQLDYVMSGPLGYVTPDMIKGHDLKARSCL